jgi:cellulose synthase/poly-beta-1,6-N-acetylglucosamine synthase-like glycosyltransferase
MVAIEFEMIYCVSHPGRARLHGFGIFGGSNGFWRTDLLREIRMRGSMLTEDIDSALRAVEAGYTITSDPYLVSRELSPTTLKGLTNQRLRWAQGWYQVAKVRIGPSLVAANLSLGQKLGMFHLLAWREAFPWLSMQIVPIIAYWMWRAGSVSAVDWFVPLLLWISLFIFVTGPGQVVFTWIKADPQIKRHPGWFWSYLGLSILFYAGFKNILARVANLKELLGEKAWKVTPRS